MIDLKHHLAASRRDLERFATLCCILMSLFTAFLAWKGSPSWPASGIVAGIFLAVRFTMPQALRLLYVVWMSIGSALAWVNTRVLLGVLFYLVMTPIGLVMRAMGRDILGLKLDPQATTYWVSRTGPSRGRERYEQIF